MTRLLAAFFALLTAHANASPCRRIRPSRMTRNILILMSFLFLCVGHAYAQGSVQQSGTVTSGHVPAWSYNNILTDGGSANNGKITNFGITGAGGTGPSGTNFCDYDAPTSNAGGYHYLCMSPNAAGSALIDYGYGGGASPLTLNFLINGVDYPFPGGIGPPLVAGVAAVTASNLTSVPAFNLQSYYAGTRGGGGVFVTGPATTANGCTILNDSVGNSFYRLTTTYSAKECGVKQDATANNLTSGTDDTVALQNWINLNAPHLASPGISRITAPLICNNAYSVISGPPRVGNDELAADSPNTTSVLPLFVLQADNTNGGFDGPSSPTAGAAIIMNAAGCAIQDIGVIGDGSGNYDILDLNARSNQVRGSYLGGGYDAINMASGGEDIEIFDSFITNSTNANIAGNAPNVRIMRNVIAISGGDDIDYGGTDMAIEQNTIETACDFGVHLAQGGTSIRIVGNFFDINGSGTQVDSQNTCAAGGTNLHIGTGGGTSQPVYGVVVTGNTFQRAGEAAEVAGQVSAQVDFGGNASQINFAGNSYISIGNTASNILAPDYVFNSSTGIYCTDCAVEDNPPNQNIGVYSPNALTLGLSAYQLTATSQNFITGMALSNQTTSSKKIAIAAGMATDAADQLTIPLSSPCDVNLASNGLGGLDTGNPSEGATYNFFAVSGPGGRAPNCMASLSAGPPNISGVSAYGLNTNGIVTSGSTYIIDAGAGTAGTCASSCGQVTAGMQVGDYIVDTTTPSNIASNTQITSLSQLLVVTTGTTVQGSRYINAVGNLTGVVPGMVVWSPGNLCNGRHTTCSSGAKNTWITSLNPAGCTNPCVGLNNNATGSASGAAITIAGGWTITMSNAANGSSGLTTADNLTVYDVHYRMVGSVVLDQADTNFPNFTQVEDTIYFATPFWYSKALLSGSSANALALTQAPSGISTQVLLRCTSNSAGIDVLPSSPLQTAVGTPQAFSLGTPGFTINSATPVTAASVQPYTDTSQHVDLTTGSGSTGSAYCVLDGYKWARGK